MTSEHWEERRGVGDGGEKKEGGEKEKRGRRKERGEEKGKREEDSGEKTGRRGRKRKGVMWSISRRTMHFSTFLT